MSCREWRSAAAVSSVLSGGRGVYQPQAPKPKSHNELEPVLPPTTTLVSKAENLKKSKSKSEGRRILTVSKRPAALLKLRLFRNSFNSFTPPLSALLFPSS